MTKHAYAGFGRVLKADQRPISEIWHETHSTLLSRIIENDKW
jgi:hypothetical protein